MQDSRNDQPSGSQEQKQPFVPQEDRPETGLHLDRPVSDLRVRDLITIFGGFSSRHASGVSKFKYYKESKLEKPEYAKELKHEKWEFPKEVKDEKWEYVEIPVPREFENPNPPDPRIDQLIQTVTGLARQVSELGNQVEALQRKVRG